MANNVVENTRKIVELQSYLRETDAKLKSIANELHWDYGDVDEVSEEMVTCCYYPGHRLPKTNIKEHEERCKWLRDGYHEKDQPLSESVLGDPSSQLQMTKELQANITGGSAKRSIPQTVERVQLEFSREERLALYDYTVAHTQSAQQIKDIASLSVERKESKTTMTRLEMLAAERDAKRRRASYKNKVHTNKKSVTEVLREVIESQMDSWKEEASATATEYKVKESIESKHEADLTAQRSDEGRLDRRRDRRYERERWEGRGESRRDERHEHRRESYWEGSWSGVSVEHERERRKDHKRKREASSSDEDTKKKKKKKSKKRKEKEKDGSKSKKKHKRRNRSRSRSRS